MKSNELLKGPTSDRWHGFSVLEHFKIVSNRLRPRQPARHLSATITKTADRKAATAARRLSGAPAQARTSWSAAVSEKGTREVPFRLEPL